MAEVIRNFDEDPIESLTSVFDEMYPKRDKIYQAFLQFINENVDPRKFDCVRREIAESWIRSRSYGVSMDIDLLKKRVKPATLKRVTKDNQTLIEVVKSILLKDLAFLRQHSDFGVFLYDRNSICLLSFKDNRDFDSSLGGMSDLSEQSIGTSSHSLSIYLDRPFLIIPTENFNRNIQHVSAAISVPIHNPEGDAIGAVTFAYPKTNDLYLANRGMLSGMISFQISLVKKIENKLKVITQNHALFNTVSSLTDDSLIAVNKKGEIQNMNGRAEKLLAVKADEYKGKNIIDIISNGTHLINILNGKSHAEDFPTHIINQGNKKEYVIRAVPFALSDALILRLTKCKLEKSHCDNFNALNTFSDILGESPELDKAKQLAIKFAATPRNILLLGESGTGKELFAQAIHNVSRPKGPFITINCASLPRGLVESEFFGYEAGSFTGADRKGRAGKLEMADGGTLFLDEIGDMPLGFQPILLRALEDKQVMRIGGNHYVSTNFRVIAATNKDIQELVAQNLFREDLYYRLCSLKILVPPLRDRISDIPLLARHFISQQCQEYNLDILTLEPAVDKTLMSYKWPGNIRELQNAICTALSLAEDSIIKVSDLPPEIITHTSKLNCTNSVKTIYEVEEQAIYDAMISTGYNVKKAAELLGISRTTLYQKLKEHHISTK